MNHFPFYNWTLVFLSKSRTRRLQLLYLFNIVLEFLTIITRKEVKDKRFCKEEDKIIIIICKLKTKMMNLKEQFT